MERQEERNTATKADKDIMSICELDRVGKVLREEGGGPAARG